MATDDDQFASEPATYGKSRWLIPTCSRGPVPPTADVSHLRNILNWRGCTHRAKPIIGSGVPRNLRDASARRILGIEDMRCRRAPIAQGATAVTSRPRPSGARRKAGFQFAEAARSMPTASDTRLSQRRVAAPASFARAIPTARAMLQRRRKHRMTLNFVTGIDARAALLQSSGCVRALILLQHSTSAPLHRGPAIS